jgi:hypothetical protein
MEAGEPDDESKNSRSGSGAEPGKIQPAAGFSATLAVLAKYTVIRKVPPEEL